MNQRTENRPETDIELCKKIDRSGLFFKITVNVDAALFEPQGCIQHPEQGIGCGADQTVAVGRVRRVRLCDGDAQIELLENAAPEQPPDTVKKGFQNGAQLVERGAHALAVNGVFGVCDAADVAQTQNGENLLDKLLVRLLARAEGKKEVFGINIQPPVVRVDQKDPQLQRQQQRNQRENSEDNPKCKQSQTSLPVSIILQNLRFYNLSFQKTESG